MKPTDFSYHLTKYLSSFLPGIRGLSSNTIFSYRDTFTLLLKYYALEKKIPAEKVTLEILQADSIREFLEWLETTMSKTAFFDPSLTTFFDPPGDY
jgi:hypothetical protein